MKAGRELLIAPSYTNAEGARFTWTCDDEVVCREASYVFRRDKAGIYYLSLRVENDYGAAEDELRVRVDALEAPCITLIEPVGGFTVAADAELTIAPTVENGQTARFRWTIDGETVGEAAEYLFRRHECGDYEVTFSAANDDGEDSVSFTVKVLSPEQMPFSWEFPQTVYNVALGRTIRLKGWNPVNAFDAEYIWEVDGTERQRGAQLEYRFEALEEGPHEVTVTMRNSYATRSQTLSVNVCAAEGTYYRPADAASRASTVRVFEYLPAPGLWVSGYMYGPLFTATTMAEACAYVQSRFDINYMISLGAWGGYVVAGFDHSVDMAIRGNPYSYQSEPGVVWVAQDENGDGEPNDTWYELAGSEYDSAETIYDYSVTYYQPTRAQAAVVWRDNRGGGPQRLLEPFGQLLSAVAARRRVHLLRHAPAGPLVRRRFGADRRSSLRLGLCRQRGQKRLRRAVLPFPPEQRPHLRRPARRPEIHRLREDTDRPDGQDRAAGRQGVLPRQHRRLQAHRHRLQGMALGHDGRLRPGVPDPRREARGDP